MIPLSFRPDEDAMATLQLLDCARSGLSTLERVNFFPRQLLGVDDMVAEREYFLQKLRRHNRFLHGWGVVCGFNVVPASTANEPWRVRIDGGYALGPYGDEIYVPRRAFFDLAKCGPGAVTDPCDPGIIHGPAGARGVVYLAIKYAECLARPVKIVTETCGCEDDGCEYSRIRDSYELGCLPDAPPDDPPVDLCRLLDGPVACAPCPTEPWVVLARVRLPDSARDRLEEDAVDMRVRRLVASTGSIQRRLIDCCCDDKPRQAVADLEVKLDARLLPPGQASGSHFSVLVYRVGVMNHGPDAAANTVLELSFEDLTSNPIPSAQHEQPLNVLVAVSGTRLRAQLGTMTSQEQRILQFGVSFPKPGLPKLVAKVDSDTDDPDQQNNRAEHVEPYSPGV